MIMDSFILDIIVVILLGLTIGYCWKLNNKIQDLQSSKKDLANFVKTFDGALMNAQKSIADLKITSTKSSESLSTYIKKSEELISDLEFIINKGSRIADKLEDVISAAEQHEGVKKLSTSTTKSTRKKTQAKTTVKATGTKQTTSARKAATPVKKKVVVKGSSTSTAKKTTAKKATAAKKTTVAKKPRVVAKKTS